MKTRVFWIAMVLLWLVACTPDAGAPAAETEVPVGLANPASVYCEEQGGRLEMRSDANGSYGVCIFEEGSECEEWAYWRGECGPPSTGERVNVALEAGLAQAVKLELLELDPATESSQPYRPRLTIEEELQLDDIVRSLNTAAPRTPKTLCVPTFQLRFHRADGSLQEIGYLCDPAQPILSGAQGFWDNQEAAVPGLFVALMERHLGSEGEQAPGQSLTPLAPDAADEVTRAVAWYGYVTGSEGGDLLVLYPAGAGQLALVGDDDEVRAQIAALRDKPEPGRNAHFWGRVDCDAGGCTLAVERIRVNGPGPFFPAERVEGWEGTLISMGAEPGSGPDDAFVLAGAWPLHYGVWSQDPELAAQLESLRDTGRSFHIWGELTAGVPDANATQIAVTRIEPLD
jgi:putative hemolysin